MLSWFRLTPPRGSISRARPEHLIHRSPLRDRSPAQSRLASSVQVRHSHGRPDALSYRDSRLRSSCAARHMANISNCLRRSSRSGVPAKCSITLDFAREIVPPNPRRLAACIVPI